MTVTLLAAVARNGVIGVDGGLPWHLPEELALFKELTLGHVLVMGRRTYESVGRPLPGRTTIVVTRSADWDAGAEGVLRAGGVGEALELAAGLDEEVFVVGGAGVYEASLPAADRLALTFVDAEPRGDTRFPEVDWTEWREVARRTGEGWEHVTYERAGKGSDPGGGLTPAFERAGKGSDPGGSDPDWARRAGKGSDPGGV